MSKPVIEAASGTVDSLHTLSTGQCVHAMTWSRGCTSAGNPRRSCVLCGKHFTLRKHHEWRNRFETALLVLPLYKRGLRSGLIARELRIHQSTVCRALKLIRDVRKTG